MTLGIKGSWLGLALLVAALACLPLTGCGGSGSDGAPGAPGTSTGTLSGTVTNSATGMPLGGAQIAVDPATGGPVTTGTDGTYSMTLPIGGYDVGCTASGFDADSTSESIVAGVTTTCDFDMVPTSMVKISFTGVPSPASPGQSFGPTVTATPFDGSTVLGYHWEQENSVVVTIQNEDTATPTVILPADAVYKEYLVKLSHQPYRWGVVAITPHQLEQAETVTLVCEVTTTSGTYSATVDVVADLDYGVWASGIRNVPTNVPVLLGGKTQASYDWSMVSAPAGNTASLNDATSKNPWFVPDAQGEYVFQVTDLVDGPVTVPVFVGDWMGGVAGYDNDGPFFDSMCVGCHAGSPEWNEAYDAWRGTGHAHIFQQNVNTGGHYSSSCFSCHTVGYDPTADNNGMDDQDDYADFLATMFPGGTSHPHADNYDEVLANWPNTASMTNIQCEVCHGPNGLFGQAHNWSAPPLVDLAQEHPRISLAADVCGYCHGEPPRHGRYQQWEESAHGNYELAESETGTSCNYCHTAQGYVNEYTKYLAPGNPDPGSVTLADDEAHPITCAVCHDPHDVGTSSSDANDAPMRVMDNAYNLANGFDATNVGKGAVCITCHNGRRNLPSGWSPDRAPHGAAQSDVLFGINAWFVPLYYRGAHSFLADTCVTCHVQFSPPPADYSLNGGGTNHSFEAKLSICGECHGAFDGGTMADAFDTYMEALKEAIQDQYLVQIMTLVSNGYEVVLDGVDAEDEGVASPLTITITDWTLVSDIEFGTSHGGQAISVTYNGTTVYHVRCNSGTTIQDIGGTYGSLVSSTLWDGDPDDELGKSGWNYLLLSNDSSHGFHNPGFATDIVVSTFEVLEAMSWTFP